MPVIMRAGHVQKLPVFCLLKVPPSTWVALLQVRCELGKAGFQHGGQGLPGSRQEPCPQAGEHEAPGHQLKDRGTERFSGPKGKAQRPWQY